MNPARTFGNELFKEFSHGRILSLRHPVFLLDNRNNRYAVKSLLQPISRPQVTPLDRAEEQLAGMNDPGPNTAQDILWPTDEYVASVITVPISLKPRRLEFAKAVVAACQLVQRFAFEHGWMEYCRERLFHSVEIFTSQDLLWRRMLGLNGISEDLPMPTDALTAGLEGGVLLAITPEEAQHTRPEYFRNALEDWTKALAHEIIHALHVRLLNGDEDRMGPTWFYEGFAILGSDQPLGADLKVGSAEDALRLAHTDGRGAYARYAAAIRFFAEKISLSVLLAKAGDPDFETWLLGAEL